VTAGGLRCGFVSCSRGAVRFDDRRLCSASSESRLATRDLTLAIATFIWTGLLCASYDRLIPFSFLILIGCFATLAVAERGVPEAAELAEAYRAACSDGGSRPALP
jgi:hypothetical protein